jgi:hypothetical protein
MTMAQPRTETTWRNHARICLYSDSERDLGYIIREGDGWLAFDATHSTPDGSAFLPLGFFASITQAKEAVQNATNPWRV